MGIEHLLLFRGGNALFFLFQKKMNPFSNSFSFCNSMFCTILIQLIVSLFIKSNACTYIYRVINFWSARAWTQFISPHFQAHIKCVKCTLKSQALFSKSYITRIILLLTRLLIRFTVDTLTFISSAHRSSGYSRDRYSKSVRSSGVKLQYRRK